jgi:hypothetical protein
VKKKLKELIFYFFHLPSPRQSMDFSYVHNKPFSQPLNDIYGLPSNSYAYSSTSSSEDSEDLIDAMSEYLDQGNDALSQISRGNLERIAFMLINQEAILVKSEELTLGDRKFVHMEVWDKNYRNILLSDEEYSAFDRAYDNFFIWMKNALPEDKQCFVRSLKLVLRALKWGMAHQKNMISSAISTVAISLFTFLKIQPNQKTE